MHTIEHPRRLENGTEQLAGSFGRIHAPGTLYEAIREARMVRMPESYYAS